MYVNISLIQVFKKISFYESYQLFSNLNKQFINKMRKVAHGKLLTLIDPA